MAIVSFTLDPKNPPRMTKTEKAKFDAMRDSDIDFSDTPETVGVAWTRPGALVTPENKQQVTLRIDGDVLAYFKRTGSRYQTRMNNVLRAFVQAQQQAPVPKRRASR